MRVCLMLKLGLATLLQIPVPSEARGKASPAQVVQAFLQTSYDRENKSGRSALQKAVDRYGSGVDTAAIDGCYRLAAERWAIRRTQIQGDTASVATDIWVWEAWGCEGSERFFPAKRFRLTFTLAREDGEWRLETYHPLLRRGEALRARDEPLYLVIAGSFRSRRAAELHSDQLQEALTENGGFATTASAGDFAHLRPGWFIVLPDEGQTSSLSEARQVQARLAKSGVSAYVRRIH